MSSHSTTPGFAPRADPAGAGVRSNRLRQRREARALAPVPPEQLFARLDDPARLGEHMQRPSAMMGGGRMGYELDAGRGQAVGSRIRMAGRAFGLPLSVEEVVAEREPPRRKVWRTVGAPRLMVIGDYEMGFETSPADGGSELRVWIDYDLPRGAAAVAGRLFGGAYARWCVDQIVADATRAFPRNA